MKISIIIFISLVCCINAFAQCNLVKDPSFEVFEGDNPPVFIDQLAYWKLQKENTEGGYIHEKSKYWGYNNARGSQKPFHGKGYVWLKLGAKLIGEYHNFGDLKRSYLETKLTEPMVKDSIYDVSFQISFAEKSSLAIDKIGCYFSEKPLPKNYGDFIQFYYIPEVESRDIVWDDKEAWVTISGKYKAKGGEEYLTLGHFGAQYDFKYKIYKSKSHFPESFYFVDQVEVLKPKGLCLQDSLVAHIEIKQDTLLVFPQVQFATASASLEPSAFVVLDQLAIYLKANPNLTIEVQGHTDRVGTTSYNLKLSQARAITVARYLQNKGIATGRIHPIGYGDLYPLADNKTEEGRGKNRRVMFLIKYKL